MSKSWLTRTASAVFLLALAAQPAVAEKQKTKDLIKEAEAAAADGKLEQAEKIACEASANDHRNKDAREACEKYRQQAGAQREVDHKHVNDGSGFFVVKNYDAAEKEFQAIKSPSYAAVKKEYLDKIAAERSKLAAETQRKEQERKAAEELARKKAAEAEAAMKTVLDKGILAYERNDFPGAKKIFEGVNGIYQDQAQRYLSNMEQYEKAMADGARREKDAKYKQALAAYQRALSIKANGPNKPKDKIAAVQQLMAQAGEGPKPEEAAATAAPSAEDQSLVAAIQEFYQGKYSEAETHLGSYAGQSDKMKALARFYLGASKLSRFYLLTDQSEKQKLWDSALADLQVAKHTADFDAPEQSISPKIAKVYQTSVQ